MPDWLKYLISFFIGGAGSLFAPWANWGIEKKKIRLQQRIELLKKFKSCLNTFGLDACDHLPAEYAQLTRFINKTLVMDLAAYKKSGKRDHHTYQELKGRLVAEVARVEAKWGIV
jgi:hypothetical protein